MCEAYITQLNKFGIFITEVNLEEKDDIFQTIALQCVILQCKPELDQLIEGLQSLGVHDQIISHAKLFEECFVQGSNADPSGDDILNSFCINYSSHGQKEEECAYKFFSDYVKQCDRDKLRNLLCFYTAEESIPPLGYSSTPSLSFDHHATYPCASTCLCALTLPTCHTNYDSFAFHMEQALVCHGGFGAA